MKKEKLPYLNDILFKGLLTFTKGVKIGNQNISFIKEYKPVLIDKINLLAYKKEFAFSQELPLTYLYLLAQRAQIPLMLDKQFSISIPGLIHIENTLEQFLTININEPIELKASVFVESKVEGSLYPIFKVDFFQNNKKIAFCESKYIAVRKSTAKKQKRDKPELLVEPEFSEKWNITKKEIKQYAQLSGDKNPIHTSVLIAKIFGFKSTLAHGWYLVSRAISSTELINNEEINSFHCEFHHAILLPSSPSFIIKNKMINIINKTRVSLIIRINS